METPVRTSFNPGILVENSHSNGEEVTHPNFQNAHGNPIEVVLPKLDMDSRKGVIKNRLLMHCLGQRNSSVSNSKIDQIINLRNKILNRMVQLDHRHF